MGSIDGNGLFQAGENPGVFRVEAASLNGFVEFLFGTVVQSLNFELTLSFVSEDPTMIQLVLPAQRSGLVLEASNDLIQWTPIRELGNGEPNLLNLPTDGPQSFFRLRRQQ